MKTKLKRALCLLLTLLTVMSVTVPTAFAATTRYNVSYEAVNGNASDKKLPDSITKAYTEETIVFNFQVDSSQKLKSVSLYIQAPGASKYTLYKTDTAKNFMRYTSFQYKVGTKTGTLKYYFTVKYYNNSTKKYTGSITIAKATFSPVWPCASSNAYKVTCMYYYKTGAKHSTRYGYNKAMDITGGGNIVAVEAGKVETVQNLGSTSFGKYVVILHSNGTRSLYAHLSSFNSKIKVGATVKKGQVLGVMGTTGNSSGVHLHFEMSGADPWKTYFKNTYLKKITFEQNVYSNNYSKRNADSNSKYIVNWISQNYKKANGWYVAK